MHQHYTFKAKWIARCMLAFGCTLCMACNNKQSPAQATPEHKLPTPITEVDTTVPQQIPILEEANLGDEYLLVKLFSDNSESKYDTTVHYSFLENDMFPLATFNYPTLANKTENGNTLTLFNDTQSVVITKKQFDYKAHKLGYNKASKDGQNFLSTIDGHKIFGTDGGVPKYEIEKINILQNGNSYTLPLNELSGYYEPNFHLTDVYLPKDGRIIIWMINSDGAGGYYVVWVWKNGRVVKRFVELGF